MAVTININNLTLCHKGDNIGVAIATLPDVCKTPPGPVPIPYPNIAYSKHLKKGTKTIKVDGGNMAAKKGSEFSRSTGDEPGVAKGIISNTNMKEATWITYSFDVKFERKGACRLTDKMFMNHKNTACLAGFSTAKLTNPKLRILCEIFCEAREKGRKFKAKNPNKRFNYSNEAKKLSQSSKYQSALKKLGKFVPEKSVLVSVAKKGSKAALKNTSRKVLTEKALRNRLLKEAMELSGKKLAKSAGGKIAGKIIVKFIPGINLLSLAWDVYDIASTGYEIYKTVDEFMKNYDTFRIRPDMAEMGPDGEIKEIYDYKFDYENGKDSMSKEQEKLYREKTGKKPKVIDDALCECRK